MFNEGEFIKWSHKDAEGSFSHVGEVIEATEDKVRFAVSMNGSIMTVSTDCGEFKKVNKPKNWKLAKPVVEKEKPKAITKTTKKSTGGSKKEKALDIYKGMMEDGNHPVRKDVIAMFVRELDMTPAGASTYAATCKKSFG